MKEHALKGRTPELPVAALRSRTQLRVAGALALALAACGGGKTTDPSQQVQATQNPPLATIAGLAAFEHGMKGHNTVSPPSIIGPEYYAYAFGTTAELGQLDGVNHYDPIDVFYQGRDYAQRKRRAGDTSWDPAVFDPAIAAAVHQYRDLYAVVGGYSPSGYHSYTDGLRRHYIATGDPLSRDTALAISTMASASGDIFPLSQYTSFYGSRETAFSIKTRLNAEDLGQAHRTRTDELVTKALGHIDQWTAADRSQPCLSVLPFMVGLTTQALIEYWDRYRDPRIPPAIKTALGWLRANTWSDTGGMTPGTGAFMYIDINTSILDPALCGSGANQGGRYPSPDLSLLIAPAYAWYYWYSHDETYRLWAEDAWKGSSGVAEVFWAQKQYNQSYRWSTKLLDWRERGNNEWPAATAITLSAPANAAGRANAPSAPFTVALAGEQRSVGVPVVVTPSDNGKGGTFFPATARLTTDSPSAIFRYRPSAGTQGAVSISVANSGALQGPVAVIYTVSGVAPFATGFAISGPATGKVGTAAQYTVSLVPAGAVPPMSMDAMGGFMLVGVSDGATGYFQPQSAYPWRGSVSLSADRPSAAFYYVPSAGGTITLTSGTYFDGMLPSATGLPAAAPMNIMVAP